MTRAKVFALVLGGVLLLPTAALAQSSFVGTVTDNTGGVLPGVTVEVASPVLIEKIRTAVTDGQGRYTITQLRPGTYSFTFTLTGFGTVKREGVTLASDFTGTVNAQLQVGSLEETITVSGQTPLVDVQSAARTVVFSAGTMAGASFQSGMPSSGLAAGHPSSWISAQWAWLSWWIVKHALRLL